MHAGLALGEDSLRASGSSLLVVSRPGYGRTRVGAIGAREFAVVAGQLCDRLGIPTLEAVVGISGGGRTAVEMAAHDPRRVRRLILQSAAPALGPWPESRAQRLVAPLFFGPRTGPITWAATRLLLTRVSPTSARAPWSSPLTNLSPEACLNRLTPTEREDVRSLFCQMASGTGFRNDLRDFVVRDPADVRLTLFRRSLPDAGHGLAARPRVRDHHPANRCLRIPSTMAPALVRRRPRGPPRGGQDIPRHRWTEASTPQQPETRFAAPRIRCHTWITADAGS